MHQAQWQLQTAKAKLDELVEAALRGEPQRIARRGKDAVMVVSEQAYGALKMSAKQNAPDFVAHLLAIPRKASEKKLPRISPAAPKLRLKLR